MAKEITIHSEYQDRTESNKKDIFLGCTPTKPKSVKTAKTHLV